MQNIMFICAEGFVHVAWALVGPFVIWWKRSKDICYASKRKEGGLDKFIDDCVFDERPAVNLQAALEETELDKKLDKTLTAWQRVKNM